MSPSVVWGLGVGLVIAAIDTLSLVLIDMLGTSQWPIADIDFMANIVLYSLIGFRVGRLVDNDVRAGHRQQGPWSAERPGPMAGLVR